MKLAITFDDLIQFGGAERLLLAVHEIWPDTPVYTSVASQKWQEICKEKDINLNTSFLQKFSFSEKLNRVYGALMLYPIAFETFDLSNYDVVLSLSTRFAHAVVTKPQTKHICYMNSPGRMLWEPFDYFESEQLGGPAFKKLALAFLRMPLSFLRLWDYSAAQRVDFFIANSRTPQARISKYYSRDSKIIYPFADLDKIAALKAPQDKNTQKYFVVMSRLLSWKKIDLAISACTELKLPLKVIGYGPDMQRLENLANELSSKNKNKDKKNGKIEFLGYLDDTEKFKILYEAQALIVTQHEDFGISTLEALALGKPVIAYGKGGVLETVKAGEVGEFFYSQTVDSLTSALKSFEPQKYNPEICKKAAQKYSKAKFQQELKDFVNSVYLSAN